MCTNPSLAQSTGEVMRLLNHTVAALAVAAVAPHADAQSRAPPAPPSCGEGCTRWVFESAVDTHGARCLDGE